MIAYNSISPSVKDRKSERKALGVDFREGKKELGEKKRERKAVEKRGENDDK